MSSPDAPVSLNASILFSCQGLKAVITGGGSGIGLMAAEALVKNGAEKVYITGRSKEKLERAALANGQGVMVPISADISTKEGVDKLVKEIEQREPTGIHLLFNNAGKGSDHKYEGEFDRSDVNAFQSQLQRLTFEDWNTTYNLDVVAQYFVTVGLLHLLAIGRDNEFGYVPSIVNNTSIAALFKGSVGGGWAYQAAKAAFVAVTKSMANEFSSLKIRVNAIAPGIFPSELTTGKLDERNKSTFEGTGKGKGLPLGRGGQDSDIAAAILFLATRAGNFVTGQVIVPDGGAIATRPATM